MTDLNDKAYFISFIGMSTVTNRPVLLAAMVIAASDLEAAEEYARGALPFTATTNLLVVAKRLARIGDEKYCLELSSYRMVDSGLHVYGAIHPFQRNNV